MFRTIQATAALLLAGSAMAGAGHGSGTRVGEPAKPAAAGRTIEIEMGEMYYSPEDIDIRPGETLRFDVTNTGERVHEFNIGTGATQSAPRPPMPPMPMRCAR